MIESCCESEIEMNRVMEGICKRLRNWIYGEKEEYLRTRRRSGVQRGDGSSTEYRSGGRRLIMINVSV